MNPTHGTLRPQLLRRRYEVTDHVGTECLVVNVDHVRGEFPEEVIVEGQMS